MELTPNYNLQLKVARFTFWFSLVLGSLNLLPVSLWFFIPEVKMQMELPIWNLILAIIFAAFATTSSKDIKLLKWKLSSNIP